MSPRIALILSVFFAVAPSAAVASDADVAEISMPLLTYAEISTGGTLIGRHYSPVVFSVSAERKIESMFAGSLRNSGDTQMPPQGDALIDAIRQKKFIGFSDRERLTMQDRFVQVLVTATQINGRPFPEAGAVVLVRMTANESTGGDETFTKPDQRWEQALRSGYPDLREKRPLVIIRLGVGVDSANKISGPVHCGDQPCQSGR